MSTTKKWKNCPFCGGGAELVSNKDKTKTIVRCTKCKARTATVVTDGMDEEDAEKVLDKLWNQNKYESCKTALKAEKEKTSQILSLSEADCMKMCYAGQDENCIDEVVLMLNSGLTLNKISKITGKKVTELSQIKKEYDFLKEYWNWKAPEDQHNLKIPRRF